MSNTMSTTHRVTLTPIIIYEVRVDGRLVYEERDYQRAVDFVIAWRNSHYGKNRIRMNMRGDAVWSCSPVMYVEAADKR